MNDIRLAWLSQFIDAEAKRMRIAQRFFLNRNDGWKRDYSMPKDTEKKVNTNPTLDGGDND